MVIIITTHIVLETVMRFCNGDGRNAAIVLYTLVGFAGGI